MVKETLKSKIVNAYKAHQDFNPFELSKLPEVDGATPAYIDQVVRDYKEKQKKLGVNLEKPSELIFEKVNENPAKTEKVEQAVKEGEKAKEEKEKPKVIKAKIGEPSPEDIKRLKEVAATPAEKVIDGLLTGKLTKEHIKSIFKIENWLLKKYLDYEHDEPTLDMLATSWERPLGKYLDKMQSENTEIYIAIATTIIAHVPVIVKLLEKYHVGEKLKGLTKKKPADTKALNQEVVYIETANKNHQ